MHVRVFLDDGDIDSMADWQRQALELALSKIAVSAANAFAEGMKTGAMNWPTGGGEFSVRIGVNVQ